MKTTNSLPKVLSFCALLVTDGRADDGPAAMFAAANSKAEGTEIFTVGITDSIDSNQSRRLVLAWLGGGFRSGIHGQPIPGHQLDQCNQCPGRDR